MWRDWATTDYQDIHVYQEKGEKKDKRKTATEVA